MTQPKAITKAKCAELTHWKEKYLEALGIDCLSTSSKAEITHRLKIINKQLESISYVV